MDNYTVLLVDDEEGVLNARRRSLRKEAYRVVTASSGEEALDVIRDKEIAAIVTDEKMPGMGGVAVLQGVRDYSPDTFRILLTGHADMKILTEAINSGELHRFFTKPWDDLQLALQIRDGVQRYEFITENRRLYTITHKQRDELRSINTTLEEKVRLRTAELEEKQSVLKRSYLETIEALAFAVDEKDPYTHFHSRRVAELCGLISRGMALSDTKLERIKIAGLLHDIGKIGIKDSILLNPGKLTRDEFEEIKTHPLRSAKILEPISDLREVIPAIRHHHEKFDGSGYPDGLKGLEIPLEARIMAVADAYDAMTSNRAYRKSMGHSVAVSRIREGSGNHFDPMIVDSFLKLAENIEKPDRPGESIITQEAVL